MIHKVMGCALITMTGKTADLMDDQKTLLKTLHKEGKTTGHCGKCWPMT